MRKKTAGLVLAAAGAVLVSAIGAVVVALIVFFYGDSAYGENTLACLRGQAKYALAAGGAASLLFIFLPSYIQKKQ